jgi:DGQHR domain-containing protein
MELLSTPAFHVVQNGIDMYLAALTVSDLSKIYDIDRFELNNNPEGYQRSLDEQRARQAKRYVQEERPGTLPTAIVLNCRQAEGLSFEAKDSGIGKLTIHNKLWLVDGQHRMAGLEMAAATDSDFETYTVPVVMISGQDRKSEMEHFYIINDRQKGVPVDLVLRFLVARAEGAGLLGHEDAVLAIKVTDLIAQDSNSCWFKRILLTNELKLRTHTITEKSFYRSLLPAMRVPMIRRSDAKDAAKVLSNYWNAIRDLIPEAFASPYKYLIQRTVGAYTMHLVFPYVFDHCVRQTQYSVEAFLEVLKETGINSDEWRKEVAGSYGGMQGFKKFAERYIQRIPAAKLAVK